MGVTFITNLALLHVDAILSAVQLGLLLTASVLVSYVLSDWVADKLEGVIGQ